MHIAFCMQNMLSLFKINYMDRKEGNMSNSYQYKDLPIQSLKPGQHQPRRTMLNETLEELAQSIQQQGILQPIIVRAISDIQFEIIAGERRWRAAQKIGISKIPCIIREADDITAKVIAITENIEREAMSFWDEISAISNLVDTVGSLKEVAKLLAREDSNRKKGFVSKCTRIVKSHEVVQDFAKAGYSTDFDALYALTLLADENIEAAKALIETWEIYPDERTSLRKKVADLRKNSAAILKQNKKEETSSEVLFDPHNLDWIDQLEVEPKTPQDQKKKTKDNTQKTISEPAMIAKSILVTETHIKINTPDGQFSFEMSDTAKTSLQKSLEVCV